MINAYDQKYNPDVLLCLANLSNDEVFTPPELANKMLDLLPSEIWKNSSAKFLDPSSKSGVFLREIAKRLLKAQLPGYEKIVHELDEKKRNNIPLNSSDLFFEETLQKKVDHIFHKQLYGIAITELTSLLSRRTLYGSKNPNSKYSFSLFQDNSGNIRYKRTEHTWENGKCIFCRANEEQWDRDDTLETHAYEFIHTLSPEEIFNMKFDVIIGNPPYQLNVGNEGGNSSKAKAIYHEFISQAIKMRPRYLCMITPSRWMTRTTEGISDEWVDEMLNCNHFKCVYDFEDSSVCFPGVEIKGGVSYFLYESGYSGMCHYHFYPSSDDKAVSRFDYLDSMNSGVVIRDPNAYSILKKIASVEGNYFTNIENNFSGFVSPKDFFTNKQVLTSSWNGFSLEKDSTNYIKYYLNKNCHKRDFGWISPSVVPKNTQSIILNKVYIPAAGGTGHDEQVIGKPFLGEANSVCSQTYLVIGYDPDKHNFTENECQNIISYIQTRFFRYLVSIKKKTQNGPRGVYQFVPIQDFSKPWTDKELYEKYNLCQEEIQFIESLIKPMNLFEGEND